MEAVSPPKSERYLVSFVLLVSVATVVLCLLLRWLVPANGHLEWWLLAAVPGLVTAAVWGWHHLRVRAGHGGFGGNHLRLLKSLLDAIPNPLYCKDAAGVIIGCNEAFATFLGRPATEIVGRTCDQIFPADHSAQCLNRDTELLRQPGTQRYETVLENGRGETRHVLYNKAVFHDGAGRVAGLVSLLVDLTEQKLAAEELRLYKQIVDASQDKIAFVGQDLTVRSVNTAFLRAHGQEAAQVVGRPLSALYDQEHFAEKIEPALQKALAGNRVHNQYWFDYPVRGRRLMDVVYSPFYEQDKAVSGVVINGRDITTRQEMQGLLEQARHDWEETFDIINDAITIHSREFNIIRANKAARELLGLDENQVVGCKCFQLFHDRDCAPDACPARNLLRTATPSISEIYEPKLSRHLRVKVLPRFDEQRQVIGFVHIVSDITEQKEAEERHDKLQEKFYQSQKMESIGRLAGGVAHDFNNLLTGIIGFAGLALEQAEEETTLGQDLRECLALANRASDLVRQLLAFSRRQVVEPQPLDLNALIGDLTKMLRRLIGEDIVLSFTPAADLPVIMADPGLLEQIIVNLTINARDAMPDGGTIYIETGRTFLGEQQLPADEGYAAGEYAMFAVRDTGTGIEKSIQPKIFEPFFTTKPVGAGTGLGLSTAYGIVRQHNGVMQLYSEPGAGAEFRVFLPAMEGLPQQQPAVVAKTSPQGSATVLVVEDEAAVLHVIERILATLGYTVYSAANEMEAERLFGERASDIDLLLTDIIMPNSNGVELYERFRKRKPGLKVLFFSGYNHEVLEKKGIKTPGGPFLQKPFSQALLGEKMLEALGATSPDPEQK